MFSSVTLTAQQRSKMSCWLDEKPVAVQGVNPERSNRAGRSFLFPAAFEIFRPLVEGDAAPWASSGVLFGLMLRRFPAGLHAGVEA